MDPRVWARGMTLFEAIAVLLLAAIVGLLLGVASEHVHVAVTFD